MSGAIAVQVVDLFAVAERCGARRAIEDALERERLLDKELCGQVASPP